MNDKKKDMKSSIFNKENDIFDFSGNDFFDKPDQSSGEDMFSSEWEAKVQYWSVWYHKMVSQPNLKDSLNEFLESTSEQEREFAVKILINELHYFYFTYKENDLIRTIKPIFICALLNVPFFRSLLSKVFGRSESLIAETNVMANERYLLMNQVESKITGDNESNTWYKRVEKESNVSFTNSMKTTIEEIRQLVVSSESENLVVRLFVSIDNLWKDDCLKLFVKKNSVKPDYRNYLERSDKMKLLLNDRVVGQNLAVSELCDEYSKSVLRDNSGPRGILTLMGEPGTGKTFLAETFAKTLSDIEGESYNFLQFNMEQYSADKDSSALFGTGHFYHQPALGALTDPVRNFPKVVILFDEIEKAHYTVVQSLLSLLDRGATKDSTSLKPIDFTQAFILFTTNLGNEFLKERRESQQVIGSLNQSSLAPLLSKKPEQGKHSQLSPEFVSRLSKGRFLVFEPLMPNHLIDIYRKSWERQGKNVLTESIPMPAATIEVSTLYVLTRIPDFSARLAVSAAERDLVSCFKSLIEFDKAQDQATNRAYTDARFSDVDNLLKDWMVARNLNTPLRILVVDDDDVTLEALENGLNTPDIPLELVKASHGSQLSHGELTEPFDIILIDLFIQNDSLQRYITTAFTEIQKLKNSQPEALIFGFCRNPRQSIHSRKVLEGAQHLEGVQAIYTYDDSNIETLLNPVRNKIKLSYYSRLVRAFHRERKRLSFQWQVSSPSKTLCLSPALVHHETIMKPGNEGGMQGLDEIPDLCLKDVVGNERGVYQIQKALGWLKNSGRVGKFGFRPPSGYLLAGPPGTGKTFLAKAAAGECGLPFFSVNSAELLSDTRGTGEARLRTLFRNARELAPSIIFLDEIDSIAIQRNESGSYRGLINTLLSEMDGFSSHTRPVLVLAATNYPEILDSALKRPGRLDEIIVCDLPNTQARRVMIQRGLSKLKISPDEERMEVLIQRTQGASAAAIESAIRQAVYLADSQDRDPTAEDLNASFQQSIYGVVRKDLKLANAEKWSVACHEAGHALAIHHRFPTHRIDYISIQPRTDSLGFVSFRQDSTNAQGSLSKTRPEVEAELDIALAGREAEKLMLGVQGMSTGATHDLHRANSLVRQVIMQSGLDEEIGTLFLTNDILHSDPILASQFIKRTRTWLSESEARVGTLLSQNKETLNSLVEYLYKYESVEGSKFVEIMSLAGNTGAGQEENL